SRDPSDSRELRRSRLTVSDGSKGWRVVALEILPGYPSEPPPSWDCKLIGVISLAAPRNSPSRLIPPRLSCSAVCPRSEGLLEPGGVSASTFITALRLSYALTITMHNNNYAPLLRSNNLRLSYALIYTLLHTNLH